MNNVDRNVICSQIWLVGFFASNSTVKEVICLIFAFCFFSITIFNYWYKRNGEAVSDAPEGFPAKDSDFG